MTNHGASTEQEPLAAITDSARLEELHKTHLLDSPVEQAFDRLTRLASMILHTPVALVSLVDSDRQFFKSSIGLAEPWASRRETPLSHSFCQYAVDSGEPLMVVDARDDPTLSDNLAIPDLGAVAYLGTPLITTRGFALGALCVIDSVPRSWKQAELTILQDLASLVMTEIELRSELQRREELEAERVELLAREQAARRAAEAAQQRLRFLTDATVTLVQSLDYATTLDHIAHLTVPALADSCALAVVDRAGNCHVVMRAYDDKVEVETDEDWSDAAQSGQAGVAPGEDAPVDQPLLVSDIAEEPARRGLCSDIRSLFRSMQPTSYMVIPLQVQGGVFGTLTLATHASARRFTEDDLRLSEDLGYSVALGVQNARLYRQVQQSVREQEALMSIASHELKNPLTVISGHASLMQRRIAKNQVLGDRDRDAVATIRAQALRMQQMLEQLLDAARDGREPITLARDTVDLHGLAEQVADEMEPTLVKHRLGVVVNAEPGNVVGDRDALRQVLLNLISNAIKYSPDGGDVVLRLDRGAETALLSVSDRGVGIPATAIPHLFERFYRVVDETNRSIKGYGIGLYVVKRLVTEQGGTITVTSKEGAGSTFTIELPLVKPTS